MPLHSGVQAKFSICPLAQFIQFSIKWVCVNNDACSNRSLEGIVRCKYHAFIKRAILPAKIWRSHLRKSSYFGPSQIWQSTFYHPCLSWVLILCCLEVTIVSIHAKIPLKVYILYFWQKYFSYCKNHSL